MRHWHADGERPRGSRDRRSTFSQLAASRRGNPGHSPAKCHDHRDIGRTRPRAFALYFRYRRARSGCTLCPARCGNGRSELAQLLPENPPWGRHRSTSESGNLRSPVWSAQKFEGFSKPHPELSPTALNLPARAIEFVWRPGHRSARSKSERRTRPETMKAQDRIRPLTKGARTCG